MRALLARLQGLAPAPTSSGARAEALAAQTLTARGWRVLARNWRNPADRREELDLVCADGEVLVFVEVKALRYPRGSGPERPVLAVGPNKRERLARLGYPDAGCLFGTAECFRECPADAHDLTG